MASWGPCHVLYAVCRRTLFRRRGTEEELLGGLGSGHIGRSARAAKHPVTAGMSTHRPQLSNQLPGVGGPAEQTQLVVARGGWSPPWSALSVTAAPGETSTPSERERPLSSGTSGSMRQAHPRSAACERGTWPAWRCGQCRQRLGAVGVERRRRVPAECVQRATEEDARW